MHAFARAHKAAHATAHGGRRTVLLPLPLLLLLLLL
jgi:hypothetical protein